MHTGTACQFNFSLVIKTVYGLYRVAQMIKNRIIACQ